MNFVSFSKTSCPKKIEYNLDYIIKLDDSIDENGEENEGIHWTCLQVQYPSCILWRVRRSALRNLYWIILVKNYLIPKNVQSSLMNNACGYCCCAFLHYSNVRQHRTKDLYTDVDVNSSLLFLVGGLVEIFLYFDTLN